MISQRLYRFFDLNRAATTASTRSYTSFMKLQGCLVLSWLIASAAWTFPPVASSSASYRPNPSRPSNNKDQVSDAAAASSLDWDWQVVAKAAFAKDQRPILLFDGICNFCNLGVNLCLDWDIAETYRFASLQSLTGQALLLRSGRKPDDWSSVVLVTPESAFFESEAVLRVAQGLKGLPAPTRWSASVLHKVVPKFARDWLYHLVSENRYVFGEAKECRIDWDGNLRERFVDDPEPCTLSAVREGTDT